MLTIEDLMNKSRCTRTGCVDVDGVGEVQIHELSVAETSALIDEQQRDEDTVKPDRIAFWAVRMMSGKDPEPAVIEHIKQIFSADQIQSIYLGGLRFNGKTAGAKEDIEKN